MGFADRHYNRPGGGGRFGGGFGGGGGLGAAFNRLANGSVPLGTYLGIRVRVHASFVIVPLIFLSFGLSPLGVVTLILALFGSVLLHEFGHALGCRAVGGFANDILMWPLGGLAFCRPPQRPWPEFVTVICGPLVNLVIAIVAVLAMAALHGGDILLSVNPFRPYLGSAAAGADFAAVSGILGLVYAVNVVLLAFNLALIFYPFDGGRLVQIGLWTIVGHRRSLLISTQLGMAGAVLIGLVGILAGRLMLIVIAIFGFLHCRRTLQAVRYGGAGIPGVPGMEGIGGPGGMSGDADWSAAAAPSRQEQRRARRDLKVRAESEARVRRSEAEIDAILEKVSRTGLQSLSSRERKILQKRSNELQKP